MKTLIAIIFILILASGAKAQGDRVYQKDSIKAGRTSTSFLLDSKHSYNTFIPRTLVAGDSLKVYLITENNEDTLDANLTDLTVGNILNSNLITGITGKHEFLINNPNIYRVLFKFGGVLAMSKTITIKRRGKNRV
jgi:uncharacterized membrane protein